MVMESALFLPLDVKLAMAAGHHTGDRAVVRQRRRTVTQIPRNLKIARLFPRCHQDSGFACGSDDGDANGCLERERGRGRGRGRGRRETVRCFARAGGGGGAVFRDPIKVIINGASGEMGLEAVRAITRARDMEIVGAIDSKNVGCDIGELAGLDEALEIPIINELVMVLGSATQQAKSDAKVVIVDLSDASNMYETVRQATAFGVRSVIGVPDVELDKVAALSDFCEKASMGCVIAPNLSIGMAVLRQLAATAAFYYSHVSIVETKSDETRRNGNGKEEGERQEGGGMGASRDAIELAECMSGLGRIFNNGDASTDSPARGEIVGDGVRVHSLNVPGNVLRHEVRFGSAGDLLTLSHDVNDPKAFMPGLLLAIRRVVRLKSLVYGLDKIL